MHRNDYTMISGGWFIGLAIRLAKSLGGCEASSAQLNTSAMIVAIIVIHLAGLQAKLVEPGMQSFREMFLTPNFFASVTIVVFMTCAQFTDFGCAADIWMFQMLPEFGFALILDWAHIKTAVGVGKAGQGSGHIRRRRRAGGGEADLPNPNAEVDVEWEYVL
ncbi:hypothetical protein FS837_008220 [Tulasnella sp. UAMH 9824]|nr:hypothetical protein FS837_008220 [Tulasnella sp. UAMH 9824]